MLNEYAQQCDGTLAQRYGLGAAEQNLRLRVDKARTEDLSRRRPDLRPV